MINNKKIKLLKVICNRFKLFDAVSDGQIDLDPGGSAYKAARDAINGWDPHIGAYITGILQLQQAAGYGAGQLLHKSEGMFLQNKI